MTEADHTARDVPEPKEPERPGDANSGPSSNSASEKATAASTPREPITPIFQTGVIVFGNVAITVVAVLGIKKGQFADHTVPLLFLIPELCVIAIGILTGFPDWISDLWAQAGLSDDHEYSGLLNSWLKVRPKVQPVIVYVLSVLVMVAVTALTVNTGGVVGSPFVPFLTAPALFGPFVAKRPAVVGWLVFVVAVTLAVLGALQPKEKAFVCTTRAACRTAPSVTVVAQRANAPEGSATWLYAGVAITLIVVAGSISRARLRRERGLEKKLNDFLLEHGDDVKSNDHGAVSTVNVDDTDGTPDSDPV